MVLTSCATLLCSDHQKVKIIPEEGIQVTDVNGVADSLNIYRVKRSEDALRILVLDNGFATGCEVPSRLSPLTLLNLTNYGIGFIVDVFSDCAHQYPRKIYLYHTGRELHWSRWRPIKKGDVFLNFVPFTGIVDFQIFSNGKDNNSSNTSHTFGELSLSRFTSHRSYINASVGTSRPFQVGIDGNSDYLTLRQHWILNRFDLGGGVMTLVPYYKIFSGRRINLLNYGEPRVGFSFSAGFKIARFTKLEVVYHQSIINLMSLQPSYNGLVSFRLNIGLKLPRLVSKKKFEV